MVLTLNGSLSWYFKRADDNEGPIDSKELAEITICSTKKEQKKPHPISYKVVFDKFASKNLNLCRKMNNL